MSLTSLLKSVSNFISSLPAHVDIHHIHTNNKTDGDNATGESNTNTDNADNLPEAPLDTISKQSEPHIDPEGSLKNGEVADQTESKKDFSDVKKEPPLSETTTDTKYEPQNTAIDVSNEALMEKPVETTPDVYLDVPSLKVQELKLNIEDLNARVALNAELAGLIKINVGVNAGIKKLDLDLKGVDITAVLKVRLKQVYAIFDRALDTIDKSPDILKNQELPQSENVQQLQNEINNDVSKEVKKGESPIETHHSLKKDEQQYRFREDTH